MSVFAELKRRNVVKVAIAYLIAAWVVAQAAGLLLPAFEAPPWAFRVIVLLLVIGLVISLVIAWLYELTPDGVKRAREVPEEQSIAHITSQKLNFVIIGALALALVTLVTLAFTVAGMTMAPAPPSALAMAGSSLVTLVVVCALALWLGRVPRDAQT